MNKGLGQLTLSLVTSIGGFVGPLGQAERELDKRTKRMNKMAYEFGRSLGSSLKSAAGQFVAFAGVSVSIGAAASSLKSAIDRADELRDMSIRLGVGVDVLSKWSYAAKQTGTDLDGLGRGLKILAKNAADAMDSDSSNGKLFGALGVSVKDAQGDLRDLDKILPDIADKFKKLEDGTTKAAIAQELFGKSGLELTEFLNQGASGLSEMEARARALGIVIGQDTADAADEFNDKLGDLKAIGEGFATIIASKLLPDLIRLVDSMANFATEGSKAEGIASGLSKTFSALGAVFGIFDKSQRAIITGFSTMNALLASATVAAKGFLSLDFKNIFAGGKGAVAAVQAAYAVTASGAPKGSGKKFKGPDFSGVTATVNGKKVKTIDEMIADYLSGAGASNRPKATKSKGSDKSTNWIEEDARKLKELVEAEARAREEFDAMAASLAGPIADANHQYAQDLERLRELATKGAIGTDELRVAEENLLKAHNDNIEAIQRQLDPAREVIKQLEEELEFMRANEEGQRLLTAARMAGAMATDEQIAKINELMEAQDQLNETNRQWDEVQRNMSDALFDMVKGTKSAKDAIVDFFESLADQITRNISNSWASSITDWMKGLGGGEGGGFFSSLFSSGSSGGSLFGGGRASGGPVSAGKFYRVNEYSPELLTVGNDDYLMMGRHSGQVTPTDRSAGGFQQSVNIHVQGRPDRRTTDQIALETGRAARRSMLRNG